MAHSGAKLVQMGAEMGNVNIAYLSETPAGWKYRRTIPERFQGAVNAKNWVKTWPRRTHPRTVMAEAEALKVKHDRMLAAVKDGQPISSLETLTPEFIRQQERIAAGWVDDPNRFEALAFARDNFTDPAAVALWNAVQHGGRYRPDVITIHALLAQDVARYGVKRHGKANESAVATFAPIIGSRDIRDATRQDALTWLDKARKDGLKESTIARRVDSLRAMFRRAYLDLGIERPNPFKDLGVVKKSSASARLPFHHTHLAKVDRYLAESKTLQPRTRNMLRMLKGTGCRPSEIAGATLSDLFLDHAVPHLFVRPNTIRSIKTQESERRIPLIGEALDAARDAYDRAKLRAKGIPEAKVPLFEGYSAKIGASAISAFLAKALRRAGIPKSPRLSPYSFRHGVSEAYRSARTPRHIVDRLMGHRGPGMGAVYGSPSSRLEEAREALEAALKHLGDTDELAYTKAELGRR